MSLTVYLCFLGCLYVCGGAILEDGDGIDLVQKFDSKTNEWTEAASMLIPRSGSAACVLHGFVYVIGMPVDVDIVISAILLLTTKMLI